jgi:hypothetical protein
MGFLEKKARGYYERTERPLIDHFSQLNESKKILIGSTPNCDIMATDAIELTPELKQKSSELYEELMEIRNANLEDEILSFWKLIENSKLDPQQRIIMRNELHPFATNQYLRKVIKKNCLTTIGRIKSSYEISPNKKRDAGKMRKFIELVKKYEDYLGIYAVKYAMGMYTYPNIFTEKYIKGKGINFKKDLRPYKARLDSLLKTFENPGYIILAPSRSNR